MITVRHLERQWNARQYTRLSEELLAARPEAWFVFDRQASQAARTAALALIRLEELNQAHVPLAAALRRNLLAMQESDGGWGDPAVSALCIRALLLGKGAGIAVDRSLAYLANLQQSGGIWPAAPIRRMPADPATSVFILSQLADQPRFGEVVRLADAFGWFSRHRGSLDSQTAQIWDRLRMRCLRRATGSEPLLFTPLCAVKAQSDERLTPSPGTPGEGRGEGDFECQRHWNSKSPSPQPSPGVPGEGAGRSAGISRAKRNS